jgi:hypothetical protein
LARAGGGGPGQGRGILESRPEMPMRSEWLSRATVLHLNGRVKVRRQVPRY